MLFAEWQDYLRWRDSLAEAVDARFYPMGWLDAEVWSGRARFWSNADGAIIAGLRVYPTGAREVHGLVAAGDLAAIQALIPWAEAWGRELGCAVVTIESRPGWARAMQHDGYAVHQIAIRKEL